MAGDTRSAAARQKYEADWIGYCELRDQGMLPVEAGREVGYDLSATLWRRERAYKKLRGIPLPASWGRFK